MGFIQFNYEHDRSPKLTGKFNYYLLAECLLKYNYRINSLQISSKQFNLLIILFKKSEGLTYHNKCDA